MCLKSLGRGMWQDSPMESSMLQIKPKFSLRWPEFICFKTHAENGELEILSGGFENKSVFRLQHETIVVSDKR